MKEKRFEIINYWPVALIIPLTLLLWGISYGLPLHLIGDEESLIGGALKMLEIRQYIPSLNPVAFDPLYYPVVLPYLLILALFPVFLFQFIAHGFSVAALQAYLLLNLNEVWLTARLLSVAATICLIIVTYLIAKDIYTRRIAIFAASLFSVSFYVINLGHWMRHWTIMTLFVYLTFYSILRYMRGASHRWYVPSIVAALGIGVSYVAVIGHLVSGLYVIAKKKTLGDRFWKFVVRTTLLAGILTAIIISLYYQDFLNQVFREDSSVTVAKSVSGFLATLGVGFLALMLQEAALIIPALLGLASVRRFRKDYIVIFSILIAYLLSIYLFYHMENRYIFILLPLLAIAAGIFFDELVEKAGSRVGISLFALCIVFSLAVVIRYDWLLAQPDTRVLARSWMLQHASDEMIIASPQIMAPRSNEALRREQRFASLRAYERYQLAQSDLSRTSPIGLSFTNVHFWKSEATLDTLNEYLDEFHPRYALIQYWDLGELQGFERSLQAGSDLVVRFSQTSSSISYDINGNLSSSVLKLFSLERPGPNVAIYALRYR